MTTDFLLLVLSAISLPALAVLALLLRRQVFTGKAKLVFLVLGLSLLCYVIIDTIFHHGEELGFGEVLIGLITACVTFTLLAIVNHKHTHAQEEAGAKGIVISEAFHSLIDGTVIGATYLVSPLLGYAATVGIIVHELPKIVGTLAVFRALGLSVKKTMFYGVLAQSGSPVAAVLVYMLGKQFTHEDLHSLEVASISSLATIVLWIIFLEIRHHFKHDHTHKETVGP